MGQFLLSRVNMCWSQGIFEEYSLPKKYFNLVRNFKFLLIAIRYSIFSNRKPLFLDVDGLTDRNYLLLNNFATKLHFLQLVWATYMDKFLESRVRINYNTGTQHGGLP